MALTAQSTVLCSPGPMTTLFLLQRASYASRLSSTDPACRGMNTWSRLDGQDLCVCSTLLFTRALDAEMSCFPTRWTFQSNRLMPSGLAELP